MADGQSAYEDPDSVPAAEPERRDPTRAQMWSRRGWYESVRKMREFGGKVGSRAGAPVVRDGRGL